MIMCTITIFLPGDFLLTSGYIFLQQSKQEQFMWNIIIMILHSWSFSFNNYCKVNLIIIPPHNYVLIIKLLFLIFFAIFFWRSSVSGCNNIVVESSTATAISQDSTSLKRIIKSRMMCTIYSLLLCNPINSCNL